MKTPGLCIALLAAGLLAGCATSQPERTLAGTGDPFAQTMRVAEATYAAGDYASAIGLYRRAAGLAPKDATPLIRLGAALNQVRAWNDAAAVFQDAIALKPNDPEARRGLANALLALDQPELAQVQLELALAYAWRCAAPQWPWRRA